MHALAPLVALALLSDTPKGHVPNGDCGGEHVRLSVARDGATIEFDCAHGTLETMTLDKEGRFDVKGRFVREHMGPTLKDEPQEGQPARYKGTVQGDTMTLDVVPEGGEALGPFHLTRGGRPHVVKCR